MKNGERPGVAGRSDNDNAVKRKNTKKSYIRSVT